MAPIKAHGGFGQRRSGRSLAPVADNDDQRANSLEISVHPRGSVDFVVLVGEIDFATAGRVRSTIDDLLTVGRNQIVVDLEAVTFLDAAAIGTIITATCAAALAGGKLEVTHNARFVELLKITCEIHRVNVAESMRAPVVVARPAGSVPLESLVERSGRGDEAAFAALYDATAARSYGLCLTVLGDPERASEVVQEAYAYLWEQTARFQSSQSSATSWILRTVHERAVSRLRSASPAARQGWDGSNSPGRGQAAGDQSPTARQAVELAYYEGRTHHEIELRGGLAPGTAQVQIRDGLLELRDAMGDQSAPS